MRDIYRGQRVSTGQSRVVASNQSWDCVLNDDDETLWCKTIQ